MAIEPDFVRFVHGTVPGRADETLREDANIIDLGRWAPLGGRNMTKIDDIGQLGMRIKATYPDRMPARVGPSQVGPPWVGPASTAEHLDSGAAALAVGSP